ncbi:MAG TPA: hypothetical protein VHG28_16395 [Longimicrobiaceae bacterium]|nr:hypothetical protein [Longimicrobiaceae bacterium]
MERSGLDHTIYGRAAGERFAAFAAAFLERVARQNLAAAAGAGGADGPAPAPVREGRSVYLHPLARPVSVAGVLVTGALVAFLAWWEPASGATRLKAVSLLVLALAFAGRVFTARAPSAGSMDVRPDIAAPRR